MIAVICPACPPDGSLCALCGGVGIVDSVLLYRHEPKIRADVVGQALGELLARPLVYARAPIGSEPAPPVTPLFPADDWVRFRDCLAAVPGMLIAFFARLAHRRQS